MIEITDLHAGYGKTPVLRGLSLNIPKGCLLSIIGANGCGKSTLLKTTIGLLPAMSGTVLLDGTPITSLSQREIARKAAYLSQGKDVPDMTVSQMVLLGRFPHLSYPRRYGQKDREIAEATIREMRIAQHAERPLATLSGGIRQNAYIAMALAQDTDYILLDEPTTYLDIACQLELMRTLSKLARDGKGIVTVMHDLPLAFNCSDRIAVMQNGSIVACDTPENVCKSGVIRSVFRVELLYNAADGQYHYRHDIK